MVVYEAAELLEWDDVRYATSRAACTRVLISRAAATLLLALFASTPLLPPTQPAEAAGCPARLQRLVDAAAPGALVEAPACVYRETVTITKPLTLRGRPGAVISGAADDEHETWVRPAWVVVRADDVTVEGFAMRHATTRLGAGAVRAQGTRGLVLRDNDLGHTTGAVVDLAETADALVEGNAIHHGYLGVHGGDSVGAVVRGNRIHSHNLDQEVDWEWEAGGLKLTKAVRALVEGNEVYDNHGPGLWCDIRCRDVTFRANRVHGNAGPGIWWEISTGAEISGNVVWNNGFGKPRWGWGWGAGILISSAAGAEVHGNTIAWNAAGISVNSQGRDDSPGPHTGSRVRDDAIVQDVVGEGREALGWRQDWDGVLFDRAAGNRGRGNAYWFPGPEDERVRFEWKGEGHRSLAAFNATPGGEGGRYLSDAEKDAALAAAGIPASPPER